MDTGLIPIAVALCAWLVLMWQINRLRGERDALDDALKTLKEGPGGGSGGFVVYVERRHYSCWDVRSMKRSKR